MSRVITVTAHVNCTLDVDDQIRFLYVYEANIWMIETLRHLQNYRHFIDDIQYIFLKGDVFILIKISLRFLPRSLMPNSVALVQVMPWHRTGHKPFPEPMMTQLTDEYMHHQAPTGNISVLTGRVSAAHAIQTVPKAGRELYIVGVLCRHQGDVTEHDRLRTKNGESVSCGVLVQGRQLRTMCQLYRCKLHNLNGGSWTNILHR